MGYFHTHIEAGNIYINKPTTGAIVLRQPFGGIKKSAIGLGRKVGIYNYITQFLEIKQEDFDDHLIEDKFSKKLAQIDLKEAQDFMNNLIKMSQSYAYHYKNEFSVSKDYVNIRGEDNLFLILK